MRVALCKTGLEVKEVCLAMGKTMKEVISLEGLKEEVNPVCFSWIATLKFSNQDGLSHSTLQSHDGTIPS